jgi:DNA-binding transcriptional MocR family regulator
MTNEIIQLTRGRPAGESFPFAKITEATAYAMDEYGSLAMQYTNSYGFMPLREVLAEQHNLTIEQVLLSNGSQQIMDLIGHALLGQGQIIFSEAPTYDRTLKLCRRHQTKVVGIPLEKDGPDIDALEAALGQYKPVFFYMISDFQNPAGATTSLKKRKKIIELARQHDFWLLEDTPYRPLRYRGEQLPSLFELAPERTLYISSYSKLIAPGIRVGTLFGDEILLKKVTKAAEDTYSMPNLIGGAITCQFIRRGWLEKQIEELKVLYRSRLDAMADALRHYLPEAEWIEPDGGMFISITLPAGITSQAVRDHAAKQNLIISEGQGFFPEILIPSSSGKDVDPYRFIRLPFSSVDEERLKEGMRRMAASVNALI